MKVVLLGAANSVHTLRWVNGLASRGLEVHLASVHQLDKKAKLDSRVSFHFLNICRRAAFNYVAAARPLRRLLKQLCPDVLNVHYAAGYGLLARLSKFRPLALSIYGSDIYDFPKKSFLHKQLLRVNLKNADILCSTSHCMAEEARLTYDHPHIFITPFGVDTAVFTPPTEAKTKEAMVIGTIKTMAPLYGIDTLLKAAALVFDKAKKPENLHFKLTGGGKFLNKYKALAADLGLAGKVVFYGQVPYEAVPALHRELDIYVALSRRESFGVAVLEAGACARPVVVSDAPGLAEVVADRQTGLIVPRENHEAAADAILELIENPALREQLGQAGRQRVLAEYSWEKSIDKLLEAFEKLIEFTGKGN